MGFTKSHCGHTSISVAESSERPAEVTIVEKIHVMMFADRIFKVRERKSHQQSHSEWCRL